MRERARAARENALVGMNTPLDALASRFDRLLIRMRVLGVDGFKAKWVAIVLVDGAFERAVLATSLGELAASFSDAAAIAVDVPIGSEPDRFRRVDAAARTFVGRRRSSVFAMPPAEVFRVEKYEDACARCRELTGSAPSKQTWELRAKIREAEEIAAQDARIIEVHPEVSFRALHGRELTHAKKSWAGQAVRRAMLARAGIVLPDDLGDAGAAAADDVLDAAIAAWSAERHARGVSEYIEPKLMGDDGRAVTIWF